MGALPAENSGQWAGPGPTHEGVPMVAVGDWRTVSRNGVRLACLDRAGPEPAVLFLHGPAGHAGQWDASAAALDGSHRVLALDQRGHGRSARRPIQLTRSAYVADVAAVVGALRAAPVVLVGHSLGGHTAMLTAARYPRLVRALLVVDASPGGDPETPRRIGEWLSGWPVPFPSYADAVRFFGGGDRGRAWADGLAEEADGWWPRFVPELMVESVRESSARPFWADWSAIRCPTLLVRAGRGVVGVDQARRMLARLPGSELVELPDAGHDLHLERPGAWHRLLREFLDRLGPEPHPGQPPHG
ncbi:alpha/beta hydrolase [Micromonospora sp. NBC_01699]|uniref:alpha/beta fold hydrolase n=1 Tax=Micromonospora sp. NBC_01699 TaxID=2975984 RepID=UPI002E27DE82|nr:alpha/beta hydrolase [Micromonospora sp. NBC_01699]